jgi:hypothetical protein
MDNPTERTDIRKDDPLAQPKDKDNRQKMQAK